MDLFGDFVQRMDSELKLKRDEGFETLADWALAKDIILDRGKFSFERHEYLEEPYRDNHPRQVEMKSTQMGNTTRGMLRMFFMAQYMPVVGLLYLFPSRIGSGDFSRTRISPLVNNNQESIGNYLRDTDSVGLKRMNGVNLMFRGTKSTEGLRSDPCDMVVYDEYDLFPKGIEATARERMAHSDLKIEHYLSNPIYPDQGIDALFQQTDQRFWLLKCPKCGKYTDLVETFPDCLLETKGRVIRLCMSCRDAALDPALGRWVAKRPSVKDWRGRQFSQLFSQYVPPEDILDQFLNTRDKQAFYNYKIGQPYVEAENRLSVEEVLALAKGPENASSDRGPCWMGVDQGPSTLHVTIGKSHPDRIVHVGGHPDWSDLDRLMKAFRVSMCVVDAQPERRNAKAFAERHPGKVFLCFYSDHQKGGYVWSESKQHVTANRTESLDESQDAIRSGTVILPGKCEAVEEFAAQCHNVARTLEEKEDGSSRYVYVKLGADHYAHSFNYAVMARSQMVNSFFGGSDLG